MIKGVQKIDFPPFSIPYPNFNQFHINPFWKPHKIGTKKKNIENEVPNNVEKGVLQLYLWAK